MKQLMWIPRLAVLMALLAAETSSATENKPCPPSECHCDDMGVIECNDKNLDRMPIFKPDDANVSYPDLDLSDNRIRRFGAKSLANVRVKEITMFRNREDMEFSPRALRGQEDVLERVIFRKCRITTIPPGLFRMMTALTDIDMINNNIVNVRRGAFKGAVNVVNVDLAANKIQYLEPRLFTGLKSLKTLSLTNNKINMIDSQAFSALTLLTDLNLTRNDIRDLQPKTFYRLKNLRRLDLGNNKIPALFPLMFKGLKSLESLTLDKNNILLIADGTFESMGNLRELYMRKAGIRILKPGMFRGLSNLRSLALEYNSIGSIPDNTFAPMKQLKYLQMESNRLTTINACAFSNLEQMKEINVIRNRIHCDCAVRWAANDKAPVVKGLCATPKFWSGQKVSLPSKFAVCRYSGLECFKASKKHIQNVRWRFRL